MKRDSLECFQPVGQLSYVKVLVRSRQNKPALFLRGTILQFCSETRKRIA